MTEVRGGYVRCIHCLLYTSGAQSLDDTVGRHVDKGLKFKIDTQHSYIDTREGG